MRSVLGVILGYVIFGASAALLFGLTRRDPHEIPSMTFATASIAYGMLFAAIGGRVAAIIAGRRPFLHAAIVAAIIAAGALFSLAAEWHRGSVWSQTATILLMAPSALIGPRLRKVQ